MKVLSASLLILTLITLNSCGITSTIDHTADRTEKLIDHTSQKISELKQELVQEIDIVIPRAVETVGSRLDQTLQGFLNSDIVAFCMVSAVALIFIALVFSIVAIWAELRERWRRLRIARDCSKL